MAALANLEPSYSVAAVADGQIKLLKELGHEVVFVTTDDFREADKLPSDVEVRQYPRPAFPFSAEGYADFNTYVAITSKLLRQLLADCSTCITHDLLFLTDFLPINWAIRKAGAKLPSLHWLHWIHSGPSSRPQNLEYPLAGCYSGMERSELVYVNRTDVPALADMFNVPETNIRVVHNFLDPTSIYEFHPLSTELLRHIDYQSADVVAVYPTRTTPAKQVDKAVKLMGAVKANGLSPRIVVCNSYSNADGEKKQVEELSELAKLLGLSESECVFTSAFESSWAKECGHDIQLGVPRRVVGELMQMSDVFVLPSVSEGCSLIMLEAAMAKNLVVLNDDLKSLTEFGGQKLNGPASARCLYFSFGSVSRPISQYHPSEEQWYLDHARSLISHLESDQSLEFFRHVRKRHSPRWVYLNQLGPLLH